MESNRILKKMMEKTNKYNRRKLAMELSVDIQNCEPILNPEMKKEYKDNLFIYLNEKYEILGFLKGYQILKPQNNKYATWVDYIRNRKNLLANATYVLMFTKEMRNFHIKPEKSESAWRASQKHSLSLKARLEEYKSKKYKNVTHEDILDLIQIVISDLNEDLFTNKLSEKLKSELGYSQTTVEALSDFTSIVREYLSRYDNIKKEEEWYIKNNKEYSLNDLWMYSCYLQTKNKIILWHNLINN